MADIFPPVKPRLALRDFAAACGARASALRRDEYSDWAIWGNNGHIYAVPEGYQLMIGGDFDNRKWSSGKGWESAKRRLRFGKVTQDGDCEGSILIDRLPSKAEAEKIRHILGIPKRRTLSEDQLAALKAAGAGTRIKPVLPASGDLEVPSCAPLAGEGNLALNSELVDV